MPLFEADPRRPAALLTWAGAVPRITRALTAAGHPVLVVDQRAVGEPFRADRPVFAKLDPVTRGDVDTAADALIGRFVVEDHAKAWWACWLVKLFPAADVVVAAPTKQNVGRIADELNGRFGIPARVRNDPDPAGGTARVAVTTHAGMAAFVARGTFVLVLVGACNPRISVDGKESELVGPFKNSGRAWCRTPADGIAHDFPDQAVCRATLYGVANPARNRGPVCVGTSGSTADLAVDAVRDWWRPHGRRQYPGATAVLIEADGGGGNESRSRRFKWRLQAFADETGRALTVCHDPPGVSKWNPIEHRPFRPVSATWAGVVLATVAVLVGLIRRTTTATGLEVTARVMTKDYPTGRKVSAKDFKTLDRTRPETCPQLNYTIRPRSGAEKTE